MLDAIIERQRVTDQHALDAERALLEKEGKRFPRETARPMSKEKAKRLLTREQQEDLAKKFNNRQKKL